MATTSTPPIHIAILTVSDTAAVNSTFDASGPAIKAILSQLAHASTCQVLDEFCKIVPDEIDEIQNVIDAWCSSHSVDWVITTGGTGFGRRDVTPEAITPLLTRPAPGLVHLLLASSLTHTPLGALSRPVAGTINNTLITTLPGSVKAVKEGMEALLKGGVVLHAIELMRGGTGREVHAKLAAQTEAATGEAAVAELERAGKAEGGDGHGRGHEHGHRNHSHAHSHSHSHSHGHSHSHSPGGHHHHHHHHSPTPRSESALSRDPTTSVSARHRKSPFPLVSLETALATIQDHIRTLDVIAKKVDHNLAGHILAEDVYAPHNVPLTPTTSVDGYAVSSSLSPGTYPVLTSSSASGPTSAAADTPHIYRINTGAPLPRSGAYDSVIMVEDTELVSTYKPTPASAPEESEVRTLVKTKKGENVREAGSDVREGERVMRKGERVGGGGGEVGTLTFVGRTEVKVFKKPVVAVLSTGNEVVDLHSAASGSAAGSEGGWGGIYDTNRPSLTALLQSFGYEVIDLGIIPDDITAHTETLRTALERADLVLTTGGTSMGPTDLLKPVIERYLHGTVHFGRVGIKPGKPTTFATVPVDVPVPVAADEGDDDAEKQTTKTVHKPVFALPGNPASALVTFYVFVLPALRQMGGWPEKARQLPRIMVQIQDTMQFDTRVEFHRVIIKSTGSSTALKAYSTGGQRSSRVASLSGANGLVILPALDIPDTARQYGYFHGLGDADVSSGAGVQTQLEVGEYAQAILIGEIVMA